MGTGSSGGSGRTCRTLPPESTRCCVRARSARSTTWQPGAGDGARQSDRVAGGFWRYWASPSRWSSMSWTARRTIDAIGWTCRGCRRLAGSHNGVFSLGSKRRFGGTRTTRRGGGRSNLESAIRRITRRTTRIGRRSRASSRRRVRLRACQSRQSSVATGATRVRAKSQSARARRGPGHPRPRRSQRWPYSGQRTGSLRRPPDSRGHLQPARPVRHRARGRRASRTAGRGTGRARRTRDRHRRAAREHCRPPGHAVPPEPRPR